MPLGGSAGPFRGHVDVAFPPGAVTTQVRPFPCLVSAADVSVPEKSSFLRSWARTRRKLPAKWIKYDVDRRFSRCARLATRRQCCGPGKFFRLYGEEAPISGACHWSYPCGDMG